MHRWGEENVDWQGIDNAATWISLNLSRWGRIDVSQSKEKFGEVRVYCSFGGTLYSFFWPYETFFWPKLNRFHRLFDRIPLPSLFQKYQEFIYRLVYKKAIAKWPHLKQEILEGADWPEYLEGL